MRSIFASQAARGVLATVFAAAASFTAPAAAHCEESYRLSIRNHRFVPEAMEVVAGQRFRLVVTNDDTTPETFDSEDFELERLVAPGSTVTIFLGPLEAGTYSFFGELNPDTAQGTMTAR